MDTDFIFSWCDCGLISIDSNIIDEHLENVNSNRSPEGRNILNRLLTSKGPSSNSMMNTINEEIHSPAENTKEQRNDQNQSGLFLCRYCGLQKIKNLVLCDMSRPMLKFQNLLICCYVEIRTVLKDFLLPTKGPTKKECMEKESNVSFANFIPHEKVG